MKDCSGPVGLEAVADARMQEAVDAQAHVAEAHVGGEHARSQRRRENGEPPQRLAGEQEQRGPHEAHQQRLADIGLQHLQAGKQ